MGVQRTTDYGSRKQKSEKVLQARMGHSSIAVTMDVYGGLFSGFDACLDLKAQHDDALHKAFQTKVALPQRRRHK
jgi:integrase